jgi:phospholipid/cholesterol/gamma-HCH transport system ATP-binding protein
MILFDDVHFAYENRTILNGVSFEIVPGETLAVLGGSGSGKTTILRLLLGFVKPDRGRIVIDGQDITPLEEYQLIEIRRKMGIVFQLGALFDSLTVGDNVAFPLRELRTMQEKEIIERVERVIESVGLDGGVLDQMPSELSGGMNRRVAIARAIVTYPQIMLYDEPTTGLDPYACQVVCDLVIQMRDLYDVTSIFVTHQLAAAFRVATHFLLLHEGVLLFDGTAGELRRSLDPYITQFINWEIGGLLDGTSEKNNLERSAGGLAGAQ